MHNLSYPWAIVVVSWITFVAVVGITLTISACFFEYLKWTKAPGAQELEARLKIQDEAIKNMAAQTVQEISNIKDKLGAMSIAIGLKSKEKQS